MASRWSDPAPIVHYRADGTRVDGDEDPEVLDRLEAIASAWDVYNETGDKTKLVELGLLPAEEGKQ